MLHGSVGDDDGDDPSGDGGGGGGVIIIHWNGNNYVIDLIKLN